MNTTTSQAFIAQPSTTYANDRQAGVIQTQSEPFPVRDLVTVEGKQYEVGRSGRRRRSFSRSRSMSLNSAGSTKEIRMNVTNHTTNTTRKPIAQSASNNTQVQAATATSAAVQAAEIRAQLTNQYSTAHRYAVHESAPISTQQVAYTNSHSISAPVAYPTAPMMINAVGVSTHPSHEQHKTLTAFSPVSSHGGSPTMRMSPHSRSPLQVEAPVVSLTSSPPKFHGCGHDLADPSQFRTLDQVTIGHQRAAPRSIMTVPVNPLSQHGHLPHLITNTHYHDRDTMYGRNDTRHMTLHMTPAHGYSTPITVSTSSPGGAPSPTIEIRPSSPAVSPLKSEKTKTKRRCCGSKKTKAAPCGSPVIADTYLETPPRTAAHPLPRLRKSVSISDDLEFIDYSSSPQAAPKKKGCCGGKCCGSKKNVTITSSSSTSISTPINFKSGAHGVDSSTPLSYSSPSPNSSPYSYNQSTPVNKKAKKGCCGGKCCAGKKDNGVETSTPLSYSSPSPDSSPYSYNQSTPVNKKAKKGCCGGKCCAGKKQTSGGHSPSSSPVAKKQKKGCCKGKCCCCKEKKVVHSPSSSPVEMYHNPNTYGSISPVPQHSAYPCTPSPMSTPESYPTYSSGFRSPSSTPNVIAASPVFLPEF